jgi:hypothetical protein
LAACACSSHCRSGSGRITSSTMQHSQDYWTEKDQIPVIDLDDKAFVYG